MTPFQRLIRLYSPVGVVLVAGVSIVPCIGIMGYALAVEEYGLLLGAFLCIVGVSVVATILATIAFIRKCDLPSLAVQLGITITPDVLPPGLTPLTAAGCILPDDVTFMAELVNHIPELFQTPA